MPTGELEVEDCWLEAEVFQDDIEERPSKQDFVGDVEPDQTLGDDPAVENPLGEALVEAAGVAAGVKRGVI